MRRWLLLCDARLARVRVSGGRVARVVVAIAILGLGCAVPGRLYLVAPEIRGEIRRPEALDSDAELRLAVTSREVPTLFDVKTAGLSGDGRFRFDPTNLAVAGLEYSKVYRAELHYRSGAQDRVIWRSEFPRQDLALVGSIDLDCDLDRPARLGQPCWVRDPLRHRWLVSNGERTFGRLCAECHGKGGRAPEAAASKSHPAVPDLTRVAARRSKGFDRNEVAEWIEGSLIPREHGSRAMPIWGERLSADYSRYSKTDELVGATLDPVIVFLLSIQEE